MTRRGWLFIACTLAAGCFDPTDLTGADTDAGSSGSTAATSTASDTNATTSVSSDSSVTGEVTLTGTTSADSSGGSSSASSADGSSSSGTVDTSSGSSETTGGPVACDLFDPMCPDGFKCNAFADDGGSIWTASQCFDLDPTPAEIGEPCTMTDSPTSGLDDCEAGSLCFDFMGGDLTGVCHEYCGGSPDMPTCPTGFACAGFDSNGVVFLCLPWCDPLLQDCADGDACYPVGDAFACAPDASNGAGYGDGCNFVNACSPGLFCASAAGVPGCVSLGCCSPFCDLSDPMPNCPGQAGGQECVPYFDSPPAGFEDVGVCIIPM